MEPQQLTKFMDRVEPEPMSGCWLWSGTTTGWSGYGAITFRGKNSVAHRLSYEHFRGPVPEGLDVEHLCHVRLCVNPDHLNVTTHHKNCLRSAARRTHCRNGHPYAGDNFRLDRTPYGGYSRYCRVCFKLTMDRFLSRHGRDYRRRRRAEQTAMESVE